MASQTVCGSVLLLLVVLAAVAGSDAHEHYHHHMHFNHKLHDLDTLIPPYVDAFGAPRASVKLYYSSFGKVKLGKLYTKNETQFAPHVVFVGDAISEAEYYTLLAVDPDAVSADHINYRNFLHWLVTNIPGTIKQKEDIATVGDEVFPYLGPSPPAGIHRYYFLLFSQGTKKIEAPADSRLRFSVRNFTDTFGLGWPIGGSLFRVSSDDL